MPLISGFGESRIVPTKAKKATATSAISWSFQWGSATGVVRSVYHQIVASYVWDERVMNAITNASCDASANRGAIPSTKTIEISARYVQQIPMAVLVLLFRLELPIPHNPRRKNCLYGTADKKSAMKHK